MKKYLAIFLTALFVMGMSAFTMHKISKPKKVNYVYFHFTPSDGSEGAYESTGSWEVASSNNECANIGSDPCIIAIDEELLADLTDDESKVASLVDFLAEQDGEVGEFSNAVAAVATMIQSTKP